MKLHLEATSEELKAKGPALLKALQVRLQEHDPATADLLRKALTPPITDAQEHEGDSPAFPVVEAMIERAKKLYLQHMTAMLDEIGEALDEHVAQQLAPPETPDNVVDMQKKRG